MNPLLGEWKWLDGSVMDYESWGNDQPLQNSNVEISASDGMWVTAKIDVYRPYICKKRKGKSQATVTVKMNVSIYDNDVQDNDKRMNFVIMFFDDNGKGKK